MVAFAMDDDDRGSNASSDNEQDDLMEDAEDQEAEMDAEGDQDEEEEEDNGDDDQDDGEDSDSPQQSHTRRPSISTNRSSEGSPAAQAKRVNGAGPTSHPQPTLVRTSASPRQVSAPLSSPRIRLEVRPEALTASLYDIVPTMAAPQGTSINAVTATPDMRYWFSGGTDCYVRKYDGVATVNGKTQLTVAQRHPFVDTVVKAGVLMSYWENEEPLSKNLEEPSLSPVYSLAVQSQALWILSGLESGAINLYSVRHDEGKRIAFMSKHTSAVSVLTLAHDEKSVLSGSWDKNVYDWDLNTGQVKRSYIEPGSGQISAIEIRPQSTLPVPEESGELIVTNGTFSSNNDAKPATNGGALPSTNGNANGVNGDTNGTADAHGSPADTDANSLFGGGGDTDSLFGEGDGAPSGGNFGGDDDDEFSRAMAAGMDDAPTLDSQGDVTMEDPDGILGTVESTQQAAPEPELPNGVKAEFDTAPETNGTSHTGGEPPSTAAASVQDAVATSDSTFLAASIDGTLRVWDRRQPNPVARIVPRTGVPPWCMAACWSPDGNYIYAGRRNGTVEEFSLHKGLKTSERTFKFPQGSGAVSALRAMPNGRHLMCASHDILRLYDLKEQQAFKHSTVPFLIVPGPPRAGVISALHIDPTCKYMISAAGNRGWEGSSTEVLIGYEIGIPQ
ncbi:transcription factor protein [Phlyctema vagabunda]|uniref:Transcription factor protein n=1 Tax=Phlyctema vagabunda TaxID=108571 RepID=A0ABR4PHA4_9HELO